MKIIDGNTIPRKRRYDFHDDFDDIPALIDSDEITRESLHNSFGGLIQIKGKHYHICSLSNDKAIVEESEILDDEETEYNSEPICPYCGSTISDAFELPDEAEINCTCGATITVQREITIEYNCRVEKKPEIKTIKDLLGS